MINKKNDKQKTSSPPGLPERFVNHRSKGPDPPRISTDPVQPSDGDGRSLLRPSPPTLLCFPLFGCSLSPRSRVQARQLARRLGRVAGLGMFHRDSPGIDDRSMVGVWGDRGGATVVCSSEKVRQRRLPRIVPYVRTSLSTCVPCRSCGFMVVLSRGRGKAGALPARRSSVPKCVRGHRKQSFAWVALEMDIVLPNPSGPS
jgi:hypothetical protein